MAFEGTLQDFTVNMHGPELEHTCIEVQQGDTASRRVRIHLKDFGGADFMIPYGATAAFCIHKSDGHKVYDACEIEDESTVIVTLSNQAIACAGRQKAQIYLYKDDWDIKTQVFTVNAPRAVYTDDAIESSDEFGILGELIANYEAIVDSAGKSATLAADSAAEAEAARQAAEQLKQDTESMKTSVDQTVTAFDQKANQALQGIQAEGDTQVQRVQAAADEIVADREQISQIRTKSDAIVQTTEGSAILVQDSAEDPVRGLRVFGRTDQVATTGAQLLDTSKLTLNNSIAEIAENGRRISITGKGAFSGLGITGSDISIFDSLIGKDAFISAKFKGNIVSAVLLITLSYKTPGDNTVKYFSASSTLLEGTMFACESIPEGAILDRLQININHSNTELDKEQTVVFEDIIIGVGTEALPWEPYTGGIPAPNPDYPQELVSVGDSGSVGVEIRGQNMLGNNNKIGNISTATGLDEPGKGFLITDYIMISPRNVYSIQYNKSGSDYDQIVVFEYDKNKALLGYSAFLYCKQIQFSASYTNTAYVKLRFHGFEDCALSDFYDLQFESGDNMTQYIPYKDAQSLALSTPNGLPGIPVTDASIANYTDESGQMWCCDEVDLERGVYVQRIDKSVYDGSETIWRNPVNDDNNAVFCNLSDTTIFDYSEAALFMCNMFSGGFAFAGGYNDALRKGPGAYYYINNESKYIYFTVPLRLASSVDEWKDFLSIHNIVILYLMATPVETPLTDSEIASYRALHSNYPVTTIMNDNDAHMKVSYNADPKNYIAAEHAKMEAAFDAKLAEIIALLPAETQAAMIENETANLINESEV